MGVRDFEGVNRSSRAASCGGGGFLSVLRCCLLRQYTVLRDSWRFVWGIFTFRHRAVVFCLGCGGARGKVLCYC